jgi:hypothetical protein
MSDLAKEVAAELKGAGLNWWQRASLIVAANVVGLVLGAIVISAGGIVYTKAMSTDDLREDFKEGIDSIKELMAVNRDTAAAERAALLETIANLSAEQDRLKNMLERKETPVPGEQATDTLEPPQDAPLQLVPPLLPAARGMTMEEPSARLVEEKRQEIQQKIDKEIYRAKHLRGQ